MIERGFAVLAAVEKIGGRLRRHAHPSRAVIASPVRGARAPEHGVSVEEMECRRSAVIPRGRPDNPADVAALAVFLAFPVARNITCHFLNVDGGVIWN